MQIRNIIELVVAVTGLACGGHAYDEVDGVDVACATVDGGEGSPPTLDDAEAVVAAMAADSEAPVRCIGNGAAHPLCILEPADAAEVDLDSGRAAICFAPGTHVWICNDWDGSIR